MDLKDIKAIIDLMKKNAISEFEMERQDFKIKLKRGLNGGSQGVALDDFPPVTVSALAPLVQQLASAPPAAAGSGEIEIKSPMIGTYYRSPSPEAAPYVEVGAQVNPDTVVGIIEAMKVMNEIKAEVRGVITQAVAENTKPVEYGQTLFRVRPI